MPHFFCPVSIHALLAECDVTSSRQSIARRGFNPRTPCGVRLDSLVSGGAGGCFNPRTPCGVRQSASNTRTARISFQSTHSLRSATRRPRHGLARATVSIHALLAECDSIQARILVKVRGFNPRTPCGVRPSDSSVQRTRLMFQSTHSLRSATFRFFCPAHPVNVSIHALLAECDLQILLSSAPG